MLTKRLRDDLPSSNIKVSTFHEQCRRAANLFNDLAIDLDFLLNEDNEKEWYETTGPNLLQKAISENKLLQYDLLIVDEGQALHLDWWDTLYEWFSEQQIIAFCDPTQSFAFENSTSAYEIANSIGAEATFTLTVNLRSPRSIFNRVLEVKSPEYQQSCPRNFESDTLSEILARDTENALQKVIHGLLNKDKILPESIVIIDISPGFTLYKPYSRSSLRDKKEYLNIPIFSAAKFRGLESPVVVIYAGRTNDESALFCAYTRATSRCIVIYDAIFVGRGEYGKFGKILLKEKPDEIIQIEEVIQEEAISRLTSPRLTSEIFDEQGFELLSIDSNSIGLYWCTDWNSWIVYPKRNAYVAQLMWTYHLTTTTDYPVYTWDIDEKWSLKLFKKINSFDETLKRHICTLNFCQSCGFTTPHLHNSARDLNECTLCFIPEFDLDRKEIKVQSKFSSTLDHGSQAEPEDKKKLSIFLIAIGRWNKLVLEKDDLNLNSYIPSRSGSIGYQVAHVLVLIDILLNNCELLKMNDLAEKYQSIWCPDLVKRVDKKKWCSFVAQSLNTWYSKKILDKVKPGVYKRSVDFEEKVLNFIQANSSIAR